MKLSGTFTVSRGVRSPFGSDEHPSAPHSETFQNSPVLPQKGCGGAPPFHLLSRFPKSHLLTFKKKNDSQSFGKQNPSFPHCIVVINMTSVGRDLPYHS